MTAFAIRSRAGSPTCASAATASETCSLIISQYCAGDRVTSSTPTSHSATSRSPAASYRALTYPGAAHRNIFGPSGSGSASTASAAMACMAIVVHGFSPGRDPYRRAQTSAWLEHARELGGRLGDVGKEHVSEPYRDTVECRVTEWQVIGAAHRGLKIGDPLRVPSSRGDVEHLSREVGQNDVSLRREPGDGQPRLTSTRGNIEMLLIIGDAETPDHRCDDRAQLIHDDRVPLLPARRKPGPRCPLNIPDLIAARHRPLPPSDASTEHGTPWREYILAHRHAPSNPAGGVASRTDLMPICASPTGQLATLRDVAKLRTRPGGESSWVGRRQRR